MTGLPLRLARLLAIALGMLAPAGAMAEQEREPPLASDDIERSAGMAHRLGTAPRSGVEGRTLLLSMAVQGHAQSQFLLGLMHLEGTGVVRDRAEAVRWLAQAAAQGHGDARASLARMAAHGEVAAHLALGLIGRESGGGEGAAAARHLRAAAAAGEAQALLALGLLHREGRAVDPDPAYAARLFRSAAATAMTAVLRAGQDATTGLLGPGAEAWLEVAAARTRAAHAAPPDRASQGPELSARYWVGLMLLAGAGAAPDTPRGLAHHRFAAGHDFALAEFGLGLLHERGHGLPRDLAEAHRWFARAAEHGHPLAAARQDAVATAIAAPEG